MNNKQRFSPIPEQPIEGTLRVDISEELATKLPPIPYLGSLPRLKARLTAEGTPENPQAGIEISLAQLNPFKEFNPLMEDFPLENLQFKARVTQDQMAIESLEISMREAKMSAQGTLPMETLVRLFTKEAPDWQSLFEQGDLDLSFSKFEARTFAPLLPPYLRPTGTFNGKLAVRGTSGVTGQLRMEDFSLRPTLFSPTIDGIHFILDVDGMRLDLSKAGATIGNSQIAMAGYLDLADWKNPVYVFSATGKRAPLFRTPDLLLHGDIDLKLDGSNPALPATLGGTLLLRDSVMLMDIDPMAARTSGQSLPKPPFFSITASPMADWLLNIDISGEDFLRFRSPYIKALVSIQMDLSGTAANPIWVGDVYSTEGTIEFPGMRMTISRSEIFLTRERQDALQLDMNAIGQVASYVVSMRIDETVDDPHLEFAATPDLNNTQILHLLATGSPERSGLSSVGLYLGRGLFDPGASNSLWDRFSVEIGRDVSESSKDTLDLYYDISDKWRIHGQYDKYDAQNLNLEWEVFSR
jgi:translocation and assembly module TamB